MTVIATDYGTPNSQLNKQSLRIKVIDQNDNAPKFIRDITRRYEIKIENITGSDEILINNFVAIDDDLSDEYSQVSYRINSVFSKQIRTNRQPIIGDFNHLDAFSGQLFQIDSNGSLSAAADALNQTNENYFLIELEAYDTQNQVKTFKRINLTYQEPLFFFTDS